MLSGLYFLAVGIVMSVSSFCYAANLRGVILNAAQRNFERAAAVRQVGGQSLRPDGHAADGLRAGHTVSGHARHTVGPGHGVIACATVQQ